MRAARTGRFRVLRIAAGAAVVACAAGVLRPGSTLGAEELGGTPIWGVADLHSHQFSDLAFGGALFQGAAFDPEDRIERALAHCDFDAAASVVDPFGDPVATVPGFGDPAHGPGGLADLIGAAAGQGFGHAVGGYPEFDGWPRWTSATHQQMYYEWLERAFHGGLRLLVVHAVNNAMLCRISNQRRGFGCDDMDAVDRQIAAAKELERFIDEQSGAPGMGWYRIARSGSEAREIIAGGGLAVVLGIEVDDLFGCSSREGGCTEEDVRRELRRYHELGVRHIIPIHLFDNAFGGCAISDDLYNYGNRILNGAYFEVEDCSGDGYEFQLGESSRVAPELVDLIIESPYIRSIFGELEPPPEYGGAAHCNARGLTALGEALIREMIELDMIIDLDHMSRKTTERVLEIAEETGYPVVSGHSGFLDVSTGAKRSEGGKRASQIERLRRLGGLVGPILHQGSLDDIGTFDETVVHRCGDSSESWAQAYLWAVDAMKGGSVGLGTDFNGFAGEPRPRFGAEGCGDGVAGGVEYPFEVHGGAGTFDRFVAGQRTFDYNTDGLAHVGLLPDFVADIGSLVPSEDLLDPLFRSAEAYVRLWERIDAATHAPCGDPGAAVLALDTGIDDALGAPIADGLADDNWTVAGPAGSGLGEGCAVVVRRDRFPVAPAGSWTAAGSRSRWIGLSTPESRGPTGRYVFRATVHVPEGTAADELRIAGRWSSAGGTVDLLVNGVAAGIANAGDASVLRSFPADAGLGLFAAGDNVVELVVDRPGSGLEPVGLRIEAALVAGGAGAQLPGDCNQDGSLDISDAQCVIGFLFLGGPTRLPCGNGASSDPGNLRVLDHQDDGRLDISDAIGLLQFLFLGGRPPAAGRGCIMVPGCADRCRI